MLRKSVRIFYHEEDRREKYSNYSVMGDFAGIQVVRRGRYCGPYAKAE